MVTFALPHQKKMLEKLIESAGADATIVRAQPGDDRVASLGGREFSGVEVPEEQWRALLEAPRRPSRGPRQGGGRPTTRSGPRSGGSRRPRAEWQRER